MPDLFFDSALLPTGWTDDVRVSIDASGWITAVASGVRPRGATRLQGVAVPGVPNAHSHSFQRALAGRTERGSASGDSFWSWRERMYGFLRTLDPEAVEAIAAQLFVELLEHGFTSVAEFHYLRNDVDGRAYEDPVEMGRRVLAAADATSIGLTLLPTVYRSADFGGLPPTHEQRRFVTSVEDLVGDIAVLGAGAKAGSVRVGLALHSLRAVPPEELAVAVEAARAMDGSIPIHIHVAEQQREVDACVAWSGARPAEWLLDNATLDSGWCIVHATHATPAELEGLADTGATIALCPSTEANLGDGVFALPDYSEAGGSWAIGTDAHVARDPAEELRVLEYGQRLTTGSRNVAAGAAARSTARAMLDAAWSGGAAACARRIGRIAPQLRADIVVLDDEHRSLVGRSGDDLLDSWVFSADRTPVRHVVVGGQWVVRDGRHHRADQILERFAPVARAHGVDQPQLSMDLEE
ncbi:MAG: formimidoylglutamate deiminase [Gemmatimonadota bacterium]|nr:formimidoylglutamate deiminase [Gemmatimonadota bacterium]